MSNVDYDDYEELCGGLETLATEFESTLDRFGPLYHRLIDADTPVSDAGWKKFAEAHRKSATADAEQWEEWRPHPNGMVSSYFFGRGSKTNLDEFLRLADSGYRLLLDLAEMHMKRKTPSDVDIELPKLYLGADWNLSNRYFEWLLVLHDTAMGCHTMHLYDHPGFWGHSQRGNMSDVEEAAVVERLVEMWSGSEPDRFPLHPFTESLQRDLFLSSAEAIRIWLDPYDEALVPIDKGIEESPIYVPRADSVVEDGASEVLVPAEKGIEESPTYKRKRDSAVEDGATLVAPTQSDIPLKPKWEMRMLSVGGKLIKNFKQRPRNQEAILEEFESRGWPLDIENPLDVKQDTFALSKLNSTVKDLNKRHKTRDVLRFHVKDWKVYWKLLK